MLLYELNSRHIPNIRTPPAFASVVEVFTVANSVSALLAHTVHSLYLKVMSLFY